MRFFKRELNVVRTGYSNEAVLRDIHRIKDSLLKIRDITNTIAKKERHYFTKSEMEEFIHLVANTAKVSQQIIRQIRFDEMEMDDNLYT